MRCSICEYDVSKKEAVYGEKGTPYEDKPLCKPCYYRAEQGAAVFYGSNDKASVMTKTRNETNGDFRLRWYGEDPIRGYYEAESDSYEKVGRAHLLDGHESVRMVMSLDDRIKELYKENDLQYARVITMTSNPDVHNYGVFVQNEKASQGKDLAEKAKQDVDYNNPKWYRHIFFDDETFNTMEKLFPERKITTDYDVVKLFNDYGERLKEEVDRRTRKVTPYPMGGPYIV